MHPPQPSESRLLAAVAGVLLIAVFGPPVAQPADYHASLVAAAAAWPLVGALGRLQARGQNRSALPPQAA